MRADAQPMRKVHIEKMETTIVNFDIPAARKAWVSKRRGPEHHTLTPWQQQLQERVGFGLSRRSDNEE
jgi:hypothetical protein